jgi:predicted amidophosphoribosyltransferase
MPNLQLSFAFLHLLFAPTCQACRRRLRPGQTTFCRGCVRFFLGGHRSREALFEHSGPGKGFLSALRGDAPERAAGYAVELLKRRGEIERWRNSGVEVVVNAPQNQRKNRSGLALLAEDVARELGAIYVAGAFRKTSQRSQHGRSAADRMDTEQFIELARPVDWFRGKQALVLDDVHTTGTTLDLCAAVLKQAGASKVRRFALAHQTMGASKESFSP